jgi:hypothetical protein
LRSRARTLFISLRLGLFCPVFCLIFLWPGFAHPLFAQNKEQDAVKTPMVNVDLLRLFSLARTPATGFAGPLETSESARERYHWKGLLLQSLEFNVIENSWRIRSDEQIRDLLYNKPYWHDYAASLKQFNMRRWNDGDSFVVNYVGHPLQGAVSGYIEIQNDPAARLLEISRSREYWKSRGMAMLWATVYSIQSEIGPLGEAAIGNEGGWTYPRNLGCTKPCSKFRPGIDTYTNNTGWVDFIITPVVGTLWMIAEDTVDRFIADPYQKHDVEYRLGYPKILRSALTPARSFANVMRGQKPWYRDWQTLGTPYFRGFRFIQSDESMEEQASRPRFEVSPHYTLLSIAVNTPNCQNCRRTTTGRGIEMSYRLTHWLDADVDLNRQADASPLPSDRAGGTLYNGLFGIRTGLDTEHYALKLAIRPGFVQFEDAYLTSPAPASTKEPETGTITHFVWNAAVSVDYRVARNFAFRATLGETLVRYRTATEDPPGIGTVPYLSWLSHENFVNRGNWTFETGPVFRFGSSRKEQ